MEPDSDSQEQSKTIRDAIQSLDKAMEGYKIIMKESTAGRMETVFQIGGALAEARLLFFVFTGISRSTDGSERKTGIRPSESGI